MRPLTRTDDLEACIVLSDETSSPVVLHLASPNGPRKPTTGNAQHTGTQSRTINHTLRKDDLQQLSNKPLYTNHHHGATPIKRTSHHGAPPIKEPRRNADQENHGATPIKRTTAQRRSREPHRQSHAHQELHTSVIPTSHRKGPCVSSHAHVGYTHQPPKGSMRI